MRLNVRSILYFVAAIVISAAIAVTVTVTVINKTADDTVILSAEEYKSMSELSVFGETMEKIDQYSIRRGDATDDGLLIENAVRGMLGALDDGYAAYYTSEEYEEYLSRINGEYNGIGLLIAQPDENGAEVLDVYEGNPAHEAGVKIGDVIIAVDGADIAGMSLEEVVAAVDAEIGRTVSLTVLRGTEELTIDVTSDAVNIKHVAYYLYNEYTGYIKISMFSGNCVSEFTEAINELTERRMKCLVIDLRDNPGGSLDDVVSIADSLLGDCVIVSTKGKSSEGEKIYKSTGKPLGVPVAIIVNGNSASASEILAGAVQDNEAGVIVGTTTYGKGVVQTTMHLESNGGWLKLTTDEYFTPNGSNIDGLGITPDIISELSDEFDGIPLDEIDQADDAQLWAALDWVREQAAGGSAE